MRPFKAIVGIAALGIYFGVNYLRTGCWCYGPYGPGDIGRRDNGNA